MASVLLRNLSFSQRPGILLLVSFPELTLYKHQASATPREHLAQGREIVFHNGLKPVRGEHTLT